MAKEMNDEIKLEVHELQLALDPVALCTSVCYTGMTCFRGACQQFCGPGDL